MPLDMFERKYTMVVDAGHGCGHFGEYATFTYGEVVRKIPFTGDTFRQRPCNRFIPSNFIIKKKFWVVPSYTITGADITFDLKGARVPYKKFVADVNAAIVENFKKSKVRLRDWVSECIRVGDFQEDDGETFMKIVDYLPIPQDQTYNIQEEFYSSLNEYGLDEIVHPVTWYDLLSSNPKVDPIKGGGRTRRKRRFK